MSPIHVKVVENEYELKLAHRIRHCVFVQEQKCKEENEIDEIDEKCTHFLLLKDQEEPIGTIRLVPVNDQVCLLGRMAIIKEERRKGYGKVLVKALESHAKSIGLKRIELHAQVTAQAFYHSLGYSILSHEIYVEEGMDHISLYKNLE